MSFPDTDTHSYYARRSAEERLETVQHHFEYICKSIARAAETQQSLADAGNVYSAGIVSGLRDAAHFLTLLNPVLGIRPTTHADAPAVEETVSGEP
jgi:hypothetical protein